MTIDLPMRKVICPRCTGTGSVFDGRLRAYDNCPICKGKGEWMGIAQKGTTPERVVTFEIAEPIITSQVPRRPVRRLPSG
jgi:uncharacterized protein (DUF983 family)